MDFTLIAYKKYLQVIKSVFKHILTFDEYFLLIHKPERFCLIRHDVDRKPRSALKMAELENKLGIRATYYFRAKPNVFKPDIIRKISGLGHTIGYHYESLSDRKGDMAAALLDFEENLKKIREIVPIRTISMHGRPLSKFDNRDLWRNSKNHDLLLKNYDILGEIYLDIDYANIAYINDTGRNWTGDKSNLKDKVNSSVIVNFRSGQELLECLKSCPPYKMVFQIHPERWSSNFIEWSFQFIIDKVMNLAREAINIFSKQKGSGAQY